MGTEKSLAELGENLLPRHRAVVAGVLDGKTGKQAAIDAGYAPTAAKVTASEVLHRDNVRQYFRALLDEAGLGDAALVERLRGVLDALEFGLTKDGQVVEMGPDAHARVKALEMALKLRDAFPNPRLDVTTAVGATVVIRHDDLVSPDPFANAIDVTPGAARHA